MKIVKKVANSLFILFLILLMVLMLFYGYRMIKPVVDSRVTIDGIDKVARDIDDLGIDRNVTLIGLGEATHGNSEFQVLKLDILKTLVEDNKVKAFAMEMDYGEGVIINDYVNSHSDKTIDEVMECISFDIYKTEDIKNLIEWIKEYNDVNALRIHFYGFDLQNPNVDLKLVKQFVEFNHILEGKDVTSSFDKYINGEIGFKSEEMEPIFEDLKLIQDELTNNCEAYEFLYNYQRIVACVDNIFKARELAKASNNDSSGTLVSYGEYRDQAMAARVIEILNIENGRDSNVMITGHNGHVGYAGSYVKTMGAYLKEELKDKYYTIGTDYYNTIDNIQTGDTRKNYQFSSCDILAYQAKKLGTYYLRFKDANGTNIEKYIKEPINTGSIGESFSILNYILPQTVRLYCEVNNLYDSMIFIYKTNPLKLLSE